MLNNVVSSSATSNFWSFGVVSYLTLCYYMPDSKIDAPSVRSIEISVTCSIHNARWRLGTVWQWMVQRSTQCYYKSLSRIPSVRSRRSPIPNRLFSDRIYIPEYFPCITAPKLAATNYRADNRRRYARKVSILHPNIHMVPRTIRSRPVRCWY